MPYTPPSQRSPASSVPPSPVVSRKSSLLPGQHLPKSQASQRPDLPRSTSYLTRHRRTPSVKATSFVSKDGNQKTPPGAADREKAARALHANPSLRKSPPPRTDGSQMINGVILSPPESSDEEEVVKCRGRQIEKFAELQAVIRHIGQNRASSPSDDSTGNATQKLGLGLMVPKEKEESKAVTEKVELSLSSSARKISHSRSNTDSSLFMGDMRRRPSETSLTESDEEDTDDSEGRRKPPMVRKKSGELVRPALRPSSARRRPSSMPGTPTFSKAVHFDAHLEHIRHFLQVDRPLAVSAGSSPVESHSSDTEFPFSDEDSRKNRSLPYEWEITVANFPAQSLERLQLPVRVEKVSLSSDNKTLIGVVAAANLAFNKNVVARFTLDYWKTTSEVVAEYTNDIRRKQLNDGYDRFNFTIKLADLANLEAKTMFFCVKYCVNGVEYWDNNNSTNFQVDFRKILKPMNGKKGAASSQNGLPRSSKKSPIDRRAPPTFDDFADGFDASPKYQFPYTKPSDDFLSVNGRLKGVRSEVSLTSDRLLKKATNPNGHAFSNRYDFSASLSAAIQSANTTLGDRSGIAPRPLPKRQPLKSAAPIPKYTSETAPPASMGGATSHHTRPNPTRPAGTEPPPLASQSYNELLDKYCFFGSAKTSPQLKDGTLTSRPGQYDGNHDDFVLESETSSPDNASPLMMQMIKRPTLSSKNDSVRTQRSTSPAPMTGFVTGTSPMYPYSFHNTGSMFNDAHTPTAIRG